MPVAVLVLAGLLLLSSLAFTRLRGISLVNHVNPDNLTQPDSSDPPALLAAANRFYWLNNGRRAGPLYAKAEALFAQRGDARNELYSKIGRLRSEAETMSFIDLSLFLGNQLNTPVVRNDAELRLWCLAAKGYTDIEIDYQAEKRDLLEAREIATSLGEGRRVIKANCSHSPSAQRNRQNAVDRALGSRAGEMVAAFAEENKLATIVGTRTPGRLLSGGAFKVGHGYILGLPVAAYLTWHGRMLENDGISPAVPTELSREALRDGRDTQLETAVNIVKSV